MEAVVMHQYGGADVLLVETIPDPVPGMGEVRIRVHAAGVNPVDTKIRSGIYQQRLPHQLPIIPGWDAAGVVESIGPGATLQAVGDRVYCYCRKPVIQYGAYAEFIVLPEQQVAPMPASLDFEHAAAVPLAALTAWQSLFEVAGLKSGQRILIHAAAGGVGGYAVQMAKHAGDFVLATASRRNHEYVRSLGADMVIDYNEVDFRDAVLGIFPKGVDIVFDTVGNDVQVRSADVIAPGGTLVSILAYQNEEAIKNRGIVTKYHFVYPNRAHLEELAGLIDQGRIKVKLARVFPLKEAAEAHRMIETRHTCGKIVLRIGI